MPISERIAVDARRVQVTEDGLRDIGPYDYADAYEVRVRVPDERSAEQWLRCGLEQAPWALRWTIVVAHRYALRFRLGPLSSPQHVLGWSIVDSRSDFVHLQAASPLMRAAIIGHRPDATTTTLTTCLAYERPSAAHVWRAVGPLHRRIAPYLLDRATARAAS